MKRINKFLYIITFILLYCGVATVSTLHSYEFFKISNNEWIAGVLAVSFELGQAATLFAILTNPGERKKFMPWALMSILTIVQIIGNVYACYKYILENSTDIIRYFKEPIFVWMDMPDDQSTVILTYIAASILPIVALAMTSMITSFLGDGSPENPVQTGTNEVSTDKPSEEEKLEDKTEEIENKVENTVSSIPSEDESFSSALYKKEDESDTPVQTIEMPVENPVEELIEEDTADDTTEDTAKALKKTHLVSM